MFQTMMKWKVTVGDKTFWIYENHLSNILRKVADLQFTEDGLTQPDKLTIELCYGPSANKSVQI